MGVVFVFLQQWDSILNGDLSGQPSFFTNVTGSTNYYNFQMTKVLRYDTVGKIELIPSIVLSSDNTNYKNIIQLFLQLFDELSVYRDYH